MNTASPSSSVSAVPITLLPAEQEVEALRAQLVAAQERAAQERARAEQEAKDKLHQNVLACIASLGVQSATEAINIIEQDAGLSVRSVAPTPKTKRSFPTALSDATKAQLKAMFEANATSREVSAALGIGLSTADSWKAKLGLTNKGLGGRPGVIVKQRRTRKVKARKGGSHIPPARRAKIVEAIKRNVPMSIISRRFGISRQGGYDIKHKLALQTA